MLIALADPTLTPNLRHPAWAGTQPLVWRNADEAETFLEPNALGRLLLRADVEDAEHILSLVNYLVEEGPWEARPQIELIEVIAPTEPEAQSLITRLQEAGYNVAWLQFDREMFEAQPETLGWNGMLAETFSPLPQPRNYVIDEE